MIVAMLSSQNFPDVKTASSRCRHLRSRVSHMRGTAPLSPLRCCHRTQGHRKAQVLHAGLWHGGWDGPVLANPSSHEAAGHPGGCSVTCLLGESGVAWLHDDDALWSHCAVQVPTIPSHPFTSAAWPRRRLTAWARQTPPLLVQRAAWLWNHVHPSSHRYGVSRCGFAPTYGSTPSS